MVSAVYVTADQIGAQLALNIAHASRPGHVVTAADLYDACDDLIMQMGVRRLVLSEHAQFTTPLAEIHG